LAALVFACALVALPAVTLRALCVGESCAAETSTSRPVPFCSLPAESRRLIAAGFRDGRSPDVLAVATRGLSARSDGVRVPWPAIDEVDARVPLAFFGAGVRRGALPDGITLDRVAPTLEGILGLRRPHPEIRSGTPLPGVVGGDRPRLVVEIVWKGVGSPDLEAAPRPWASLRLAMSRGASTTAATVGSLPLDPAAVLTTIGTGATPAQHGITGTWIRDERGRVERAWSSRAPTTVVATLADDLDRALGERPLVGLVADARADRGIVGGSWYLHRDRDDLVIERRDPLAAVRRLLTSGYGDDDVPDLLAVVLSGRLERMSIATRAIVSMTRRSVPEAAFVVTATGVQGSGRSVSAAEVLRRLATGARAARDLVTRAVAGGLFLDRAAMTARGLSSDAVVLGLEGLRSPNDGRMFADVFPGFAVSFARYC
jgi:hypothetical protein